MQHQSLDEWYCSENCERKAKSTRNLDRILAYSKAFLWHGLNHLVRRDAIREGDGPAMIDHWSLDIINFANNNHPKYLVLAHGLLTGACLSLQKHALSYLSMSFCVALFCSLFVGVNGFYPERIRHDAVWNRVANLTGGRGKNIAYDLVNEFLNSEFKGIINCRKFCVTR